MLRVKHKSSGQRREHIGLTVASAFKGSLPEMGYAYHGEARPPTKMPLIYINPFARRAYGLACFERGHRWERYQGSAAETPACLVEATP